MSKVGIVQVAARSSEMSISNVEHVPPGGSMGVEGENRTLIYIYLLYTENPGLETNREVLGDRPTDTLYSSFMGNHSDPTKVGFTIPAKLQESPLCVHP
jgi:hypothetical protein